MKYFLFSAFVLAIASCNMHAKTGSGNIVTETRTTEPFMGVHAEGAVHVEIKKGAVLSVTVEADDNVMEYVETKVSGNVLKVRLKELTNLRNVTIRVYITAPELKELNASASATLIAKDVITSSDNISIKSSSAASVTAEVDAPEVMIEASSAARADISGRTKTVTADASSAGKIRASDLHAEVVTANASSSGSVNVFASVSVEATASSAGSVRYTGGAAGIKKHEDSGGSVSSE